MTDYTELKRLAEAANHPGCSWSADYRLATSPAAVLALIAENEQLKHDVAAGSAREWDLRSQVRSAKESRARVVQSNKAAREERAQLKAELSGLRTGFEAQNQVNAALKAENEALLTALKGMTAMYGYCWDLVDGGLFCMQQNVQRFEDAHEAAQRVVAALGKGEQP
ncbi:hypothetical protein SAMN03159489_05987 [Pseudomonas sp. NFPP07]|uniref:hypothetical protein n=1 Tax=Pseudomonas sp. NFPP07 TaxID=1566213 RepID=UPI0008EE4168|nr:hypothetical protein [Pseudomonas sp. NFPP07]SFQ82586.1 hypothetical protein SAMN03159489_05987 [Pseudomonas sp. NFPP07]